MFKMEEKRRKKGGRQQARGRGACSDKTHSLLPGPRAMPQWCSHLRFTTAAVCIALVSAVGVPSPDATHHHSSRTARTTSSAPLAPRHAQVTDKRGRGEQGGGGGGGLLSTSYTLDASRRGREFLGEICVAGG